MIYSFSGTGNSLWTAKELGRILDMPVEGLTQYRKKKLVCQDDVAGFVFPTYMEDLPWIVKEILLELELKKGSYVFLVMTSNHGKSGKASQSMDAVLCRNGSCLNAAFDLQMPGNCLISSPEENAERLRNAPAAVEKIGEEIKNRVRNFHSSGEKAVSGFVENSYFYGNHSLKRLTYMKNFKITKDCTGCGLCEMVCSVNNISVKGKKAVHGDQCAACYACLHWCPEHAVKLQVPVLSKRPQYHHPEIAAREIAAMKGANRECIYLE